MTVSPEADTPLWTPSAKRVDASNLKAFMAEVERVTGRRLDDYAGLWSWSVEEMESFWSVFWDWSGVKAETRGERVLIDADKMPGARFFPDARLNYAENMLSRRGPQDAIVFWGEDKVKRRLSWDELHNQVARLAQGLRAAGVVEGDRVAAYLPNMPETVIAMLATASIGAIFSSCSPDFGVQGVLDRFGQIEPKVLIAVDGYHYNGKQHDLSARTAEVLGQLPSVELLLLVPYLSETADPAKVDAKRGQRWDDFLAANPAESIRFAQLPFDHPLYIMFSSGTTGQPKCIVHRAGGVLLQHLKEHKLQSDVKPGDRVFYFTTCGWMMWNWLVSGLAAGATLLLYDGSPFYPSWRILFDYADAEKMRLFGTSAKYIDALANAEANPVETHDLSSLRTMTSTGSPLLPEGFDYVYEKVKADICLSSISGGTDIVGCFVAGNPIGPVWRGEIQARCLGMDVDVVDDQGRSLREEKGEMVCRRPFPTMPLMFWNDPEGKRYRAAYFEAFPGIWHHGDFAAITRHDGVVIYGRSDATLNPGGVRIGTAEIYRQVERLPEIEEALVIGQDWQGDVRVVLFVKLKNGAELDEALEKTIRTRIREGATPRHVPARILSVPEIPRTRSGKIVELAVRDVVHGRAVKNKEALANPEALNHFANRPELGS